MTFCSILAAGSELPASSFHHGAMTVYAAGPGLVPSRGPGGRAPQPPPQGRNTPRPGAATPPKQEKRRAEERGSEADERRRRAGPTEPGGPGRHCGGPREAQSGPQAARGEPPLPCQQVTHSPTYSSNISKKVQPLGARGPKPPKPCTDTSPGHRDRRGIQRTPDEVPSGPSSPHTPACGSRGPRRGTSSRG